MGSCQAFVVGIMDEGMKEPMSMSDSAENHAPINQGGDEGNSTFESIFYPGRHAVTIRVPDYQRAYSWEQKQIELFIGDLAKYQGGNKGYYFGHFIAEVNSKGDHWGIVDGQQRITTFVLFLMVCRVLLPEGEHALAYSLIQTFSTVSYDRDALKIMGNTLQAFLEKNSSFNEKNPPPDDQIIADMGLQGKFTRSQRRMALALLGFNRAFHKGGALDATKIGDYIQAIMSAHCSRHLTTDKSVAVNIFELQNTRGVPLTTLEKMKAKLMKFVHDHGGSDHEQKTEQIQSEFGEIYGMEERVAADSFRGEMTMEQIFRLHLRVVDDGNKQTAKAFSSPATNADADALVEYVENRLSFIDGDKKKGELTKELGVRYALDLAHEFKKSVRIVSETLPAWDDEDQLVGDVLILDRDLSCQFFLIICRCMESEVGKADGRIGNDTLKLWEKLVFTRDFHERYRGLWYRDNFEKLFEDCRANQGRVDEAIYGYVVNGFRPGSTDGLQSIVATYLNDHRESIMNQAFNWHPWKFKMIYAIYKYEISKMAEIRRVMKGTISVEHILPQEWKWQWISSTEALSSENKDKWMKQINSFINGIGNLLLLTPGENTAEGNKHPADKEYMNCGGGSYLDHNQSRKQWLCPDRWADLIHNRGEKIYQFMLSELVGDPGQVQSSIATDSAEKN